MCYHADHSHSERTLGQSLANPVASGPISRISQEPIYQISERQAQLLRRKKLPFQIIAPANGIASEETDG
jgi:hypothetical protein